MRIDIIAIEKNGERTIYFGSIKGECLKSVLSVFHKESKTGLFFVNCIGNVFFNSKQTEEIVCELECLNTKKLLPQDVVKLIKKAVKKIKENSRKYYLLFEGE